MPRFAFLILLLFPSILTAQTLVKAIIEPCSSSPGVEYPNEIISFVNGASPLSVGDISIHSMNPNAGAQPNINFSWSGTGTDNGGDPTDVCPGPGGLSCFRWLDHADPIDGPIITGLINQLNAQAGTCTPTLFVAPTGPNMGTIPAGARVIFFLGAGGNTSGTPVAGFDALGTNLDFSAFCNTQEIYALFGYAMFGAPGFGLLTNGGNRAIRVQVAGVTVDSVYSPANPGGALPEILDSAEVYTYGGGCTPPDLFGLSPLDASLESASLAEGPNNLKMSRLTLSPNPVSETLTIQLPINGPQTIRQKIYSLDGKSTEIRILELQEGSNTLQVEVQYLPSATYFLELMTDSGAYRALFIKQ